MGIGDLVWLGIIAALAYGAYWYFLKPKKADDSVDNK